MVTGSWDYVIDALPFLDKFGRGWSLDPFSKPTRGRRMVDSMSDAIIADPQNVIEKIFGTSTIP